MARDRPQTGDWDTPPLRRRLRIKMQDRSMVGGWRVWNAEQLAPLVARGHE